MQKHIQHAPMTLAPCTCGLQPKHYEDCRARHAGGGEFLECAPCGSRTARHRDLAAAEREWCRMTGNTPPKTNPALLQRIR